MMADAKKDWLVINGNIPIILLAGFDLGDLGLCGIVERMCAQTGCWGVIARKAISENDNSLISMEIGEVVKRNKIEVVINLKNNKVRLNELIKARVNRKFNKEFSLSTTEVKFSEKVNMGLWPASKLSEQIAMADLLITENINANIMDWDQYRRTVKIISQLIDLIIIQCSIKSIVRQKLPVLR